jgi:hypothetical protein
MMVLGGALAFAPLVMIYIVLGQLQHGVSYADEMAGHFTRYAHQAEIGGFLLAIGAVVRIAGICFPKED